MKDLHLNGLSLYMRCSNCGQEFEQKLDSLKRSVQPRCPKCKADKIMNADAKRKVIQLYNDLQNATDMRTDQNRDGARAQLSHSGRRFHR